MAETPSTVVCVATHAVDLDDGRSLAPGATAYDVDTSSPHNRNLVIDGLLNVTEGTTPRVRQVDKLVEEAAVVTDDENEEGKD
jgi:hypothetical protein